MRRLMLLAVLLASTAALAEPGDIVVTAPRLSSQNGTTGGDSRFSDFGFGWGGSGFQAREPGEGSDRDITQTVTSGPTGSTIITYQPSPDGTQTLITVVQNDRAGRTLNVSFYNAPAIP